MIRYHIESPKKKLFQYTSGQIQVKGWCFNQQTGKPAGRVYILVGKREINCEKVERTDLASEVQELQPSNACDLNLGFEANFKTGNGLKLVQVYAIFKENGHIRKYCLRKFIVLFSKHETKLQRAQSPAQGLEFISRLPLQKLVERPAPSVDLNALDIHWVIPDFNVGAGGHMTIFRIIHYLEKLGHKNTIWITWKSQHRNPTKTINEHFIKIGAKVKILPEDHVDRVKGDLVFATDRWTAYFVRSICNVLERFYFIQDYEPSFYAAGSEYFLTKETYHFGFKAITAGKWLKNVIQEEKGSHDIVNSFDLAYDPKCYYPVEQETDPRIHRIAFYARFATPRRLVELGFLAFEELAKKRDDFIVDFYGQDIGNYALPYKYTDHGILSSEELGELYRSCTIGMVFSGTNYALVPNEMMACGLPVIEFKGSNTQTVFPRDAISLAHADPLAIAETICHLLDNEAVRRTQSEKALSYVKTLSWERSAKAVEQAIVKQMKKHS